MPVSFSVRVFVVAIVLVLVLATVIGAHCGTRQK